MTKSTYPTKYQLEHLKKRINNEIDPLIDQAQLSVKSIVADLTESAELKLAKKIYDDLGCDVVETFLDKKYWNYSNTTGKYRNIFLNETIKDTRAKIKSGTYILTDLNK